MAKRFSLPHPLTSMVGWFQGFALIVACTAADVTGFDGESHRSYPEHFSASFEFEFQWFDRGQAPDFSNRRVWNQTVWRGERAQQQVLVVGGPYRKGLSVSATALETPEGHQIPAEAVSFRYPTFVVGDIEARNCEGYPVRKQTSLLSDALAGEIETGLPRFYPSMVWVSVDVPRDAEPGEYAGNLSVAAPSGETTKLRILLLVTPWTMPPASSWRFHLDLWQFPVSILDRLHHANPELAIAHWSETHYALLEPFYRYLARLGQRAITTYIKDGAMGAPSMVRWIASENGKTWKFDFSAFDQHVKRLADWGIDGQINAFSPVGWNAEEIPFWDADTQEHKVFKASAGSPSYNALWNNFLTEFGLHLREKGWFERTVLYMDEVPQAQLEAVIGLIRYNDKGWKIGLAYGHAPDPPVVRSLYDVSGYYESELDVQTYGHQVTTFYTSCSLTRPNNYVASDADPADMAALPWYAMFRGHDGYLRWAYDNWKSFEPLDLRDGIFTAGDFSLVYRSSNDLDMTVIPSLRSELLRDGIEDFEKLLILEETLSECGDQRALFHLLQAVAAFTTEALMQGRARQLLLEGREVLDRLSSEISPLNCGGD